MAKRYFFFSYAHAIQDTAGWANNRNELNQVDAFFRDLTARISEITGEPAHEVGYKDSAALRLNDPWPQNLVQEVSNAPVMVALICPHYLKSENCGREFGAFMSRFDKLLTNGPPRPPHRIVPIYWIDLPRCKAHVPTAIKDLLDIGNFTQAGFPSEYPVTGLQKIQDLRPGSYRAIVHGLADRIVDLVEQEPPLPPLTGHADFRQLPSAFAGPVAAPSALCAGSNAANVLYWVPTRDEAERAGLADVAAYRQEAKDWQPFPAATHSIRLLTETGLANAGIGEFGHRPFPNDLTAELEAIEQAKSLALVVMDRRAARIQRYAQAMATYDRRNFVHVGLVTAGGDDTDEPLLAQTLPTKYGVGMRAHLWTVPDDDKGYITAVGDAVRQLKSARMSIAGNHTSNRGTLPGLKGPTAGGPQ